MSYTNSEIDKILKTMQLVTQGVGIKHLADLYSLEPDAPEKEDYSVKLEHLNFMKKHIVGGKLKISEDNAEALLEKDPNVFQGLEVEIIDFNDKDYFDEEEDLNG